MKKKFVFPCIALATLSTLIGCKGGGGGEDTFTVTFETYGGTPKPENQKVKKGGNAYRPSDPGTIVTEEGDEYTFDDWYVSPESLEKFNFSNPITCDTTIYAHYNGGYTLDGKTNVDYNDFSDKNLLFKVKNRKGQEETGFKYNVYFPDFKTGVRIDENTGRLDLSDENIYLYGYVYAYRENAKKQVGYDYAYKRIQIASFDCLNYTQIGNTGNYEVSLNPSYAPTQESNFRLCVPEVYYDETSKEIKGTITKVSGEFGGFLTTTHDYPDIYISDSIEEIGDKAFGFENGDKCAHIIHISKGIKKIGNNAFKWCNGDGKPTFDFDFSDTKLESIGNFAFYNAYLDRKYIKLPATLNFIGEHAFYVGELRRPSYIEFNDIKYWVKIDDSTMNILDVSDKAKNVDYFSPKDFNNPNYAKGIQKVIINQGALSYELGSSENTAKVKNVDKDKLVEFGGGSAKEIAVTIPDTITHEGKTYTVNEIGSHAFEDQTTINNVYLSDNIEKIGDDAFIGCSNLRSIHITKNVKSIGERVFDNCYSLVSMSVDKDNETFGSSAVDGFYHPAILSKNGEILYYGCKTIADIKENRTFPTKVKEIKPHAFYGRYDSTKDETGIKGNITFPTSLVHIGADAFTNAFNFNYYNPKKNFDIKFENITNLWTFTKDADIKNGIRVNIAQDNINNFQTYSSFDWRYREEGSDLQFSDSSYDKTSTVRGYGQCKDNDVVIPSYHNGCKVIGVYEKAFKGKNNIKSISIANTITYFGASAFENCSELTELIIPKSVRSMGQAKVDHWSSSKPVYVPDTNIFNGCDKLSKVYVEDFDATWEFGTYTAVKSKTIPDAWTSEFEKKGEFKFTNDPTNNAKLLTDYTTEGTLTKYAWRKANS